MNKSRRLLKFIEDYYDDFGNTGATPIDTAGGVRKALVSGDDPYPNGIYMWNPSDSQKCVDIADSSQKIHITLRPGAVVKKIGPNAIEVKDLTLYVSGTTLDKIMSTSELIT